MANLVQLLQVESKIGVNHYKTKSAPYFGALFVSILRKYFFIFFLK